MVIEDDNRELFITPRRGQRDNDGNNDDNKRRQQTKTILNEEAKKIGASITIIFELISVHLIVIAASNRMCSTSFVTLPSTPLCDCLQQIWNHETTIGAMINDNSGAEKKPNP